jgi:hypothetical protein
MPTIAKRFSMATGTTVDNALAGSQYEFAPFDGTIEIGIMSNANLVTTSVFSGPDTLAEPGTPVAFVTGTEALPKYPDDYPFEDEVAHGDRLKVQLVNGNAGTALVNVVLRITPA